MLRRILILDAGLVALLALGIVKFKEDWKAFGPLHDPSLIQTGRLTLPGLPASVASGAAAQTDWTEIPTRNPFSFDRTDVDIVIAPPAAKPLGPKPILFGTMLIGKERTAVVAATSVPNGASRPMKVGETVDGWTIVEIAASSMQIESNGIRESVITNDPLAAPIRRDFGRTENVAGTVIQAGQSAPASAGQSTMTPITLPPAQPQPAPAGQAQKRPVRTPFGTIYVDEPPKQ